MKKLFLLSLLLISFLFSFSQSLQPVSVHGKIIVESSDVEGIAIQNTSSIKKDYTYTDENGEFDIDVRLNDLIEISSLQFQNFTLKINQDNLDSKRLRIFLIEEVNKLDEILVLSSGLTGELEVGR